MQDAYLGLCLAEEKYNPERGAFTTFAMCVMRSEILKGARERGDRLVFEDDLDEWPGPGPTPEDELLRQERWGAVRKAVARLPEPQRTVIRHRFGFEGAALTQEQTAAVMGLTQQRVQQLEAAALTKLRKLLRGE